MHPSITSQINNITDDTKRAFEFYEDALRAALPDMALISSDEFRLLAFLACDERHFMVIRNGKYELNSAFLPRMNQLPPDSILKALTQMVRSRVNAIRADDKSVFLISQEPIDSFTTDTSPIDPCLEIWLREQFPVYIQNNPERIALHRDVFNTQMLRLLFSTGNVIKVHESGRLIWRMTNKLKKKIRRNKHR